MEGTLAALPVELMTAPRRDAVLPSVLAMRTRRSRLLTRLRRRAPALRVLGSVLGVVLLLRAADLAGAGHDAAHADLRWLAAGLGVSLLGFAVGVAQWGVLLRHRSGSPGWASIASWQAQSVFACHVVPSPVAGDAVRAVNAGRQSGAGLGVASILGSRLASGLGMAAWGMCGALVLVPVFGGVVVLAAGLYLAAMLAAWSLVLTGRSTDAPAWARRGRMQRLAPPIRSLRQGFAVITGNRRGIATSVTAGVVGWALHLVALTSLAHAVGANVPLALFAVATPLSLVATWVPVSINGMGLREGVMASVLVHAGVAPGHAGAASLLVDVQMLPVAVGGALIWLLSTRRPVRRVAASG